MYKTSWLRWVICVAVAYICMESLAFAEVNFIDDFNDGVLDTSFWQLQPESSRIAVVETGGKISITAGTGDSAARHLVSNDEFGGDFDVQVDYNFLSGTTSSLGDRTRTRLFVESAEDDTVFHVHVWRSGSPSNGHANWSRNGSLLAVGFSPPRTGKLRLSRVDGVITGYYFINGWQSLGSWPDFNDNVKISVGGSLNGGMSLDLELDNFSIAAETRTPEPTSLVALLGIGSMMMGRRRLA